MKGLKPHGLVLHEGVVVGAHVEIQESAREPGDDRRGQERLGVHQDRRGNVRGEEHARDGAEGGVDGHGRRELLVPFEMQSRHRRAETCADTRGARPTRRRALTRLTARFPRVDRGSTHNAERSRRVESRRGTPESRRG